MHIFLPQKRKRSLLVIIGAASVLLLTVVTSEVISQNHEFQTGMTMQWAVLLPEFIFFMAAIIVFAGISYLQLNKKISILVNEALESISSGIIYFDKDGTMVRFNPAAAIMLPDISIDDRDSKNYIRTYKRFLSYVYDRSLDIQDQSKLTFDINQMNMSKLLFREVVEFNSRIVLVQFYQRPSSDIIAVLTDISMMKRHIDEVVTLTEENRIMIKAIEAAGSGMMIAEIVDSECTVIFSNDVFARALRQNMDTIIGHNFPEVLENSFEQQMKNIREGIRTARKEGSAENIWLKMRPDSKTVLWYAFYILFFKDTNDKEFYVCFLSDQTQTRLEQGRVFQAQKLEAVAQLAGGIAHDFNNILSVIDGFSKLMKRGIEKGTGISGFFENIDRSVQRGTQITGRLLTFGQRRVTQKIRLDICEHVKAMEAFLSPMMEGSINMIVNAQDEALHIDASPDAVTQIIMSLAANAREAMKDGGDLVISAAKASKSQLLSSQKPVERNQDYVCIQVIDNGKGMDQTTLARVYEPFFTTKDPAKYSGLGMSLVYGLAKEMGAFIDIKSTKDVGTSVSILVPVRQAPAHRLFNEPVVKINPDILKNKTILVVEDSPDVLEMEYQLLKESKLHVLKAANADEALRIREEYHGSIDFLLTDITLPEMNGVELSKVFEEISPETVSILISAYPALEASAKSSDGKIILAKPLVYEKLEDIMIGSLTGRHGRLEEHAHWVKREEII